LISVEEVVGGASLGDAALGAASYVAGGTVVCQAHPRVTAVVAVVVVAASGRFVTCRWFIRGKRVTVVVYARATACADQPTASPTGPGVVEGAVFVGVVVGTQILGPAGDATDDARLAGEVAARGNAAGVDVVTVALGQPIADAFGIAAFIGRECIKLVTGQGGEAILARLAFLAVAVPAAHTGVGVGLTVLGAGGSSGALGLEREETVHTATEGLSR